MVLKVPFAASEKTGKDKPKPGMALVDVAVGTVNRFENVEKFAFSDDSRWLAYQLSASEAKAGDKPAAPGAAGAGARAGSPAEAASNPRADAARAGGPLKLRDLAAGSEREIPSVASFAFDPGSKALAVTVSAPEGKGNGVFVYSLADAAAAPGAAAQADKGRYESLTWAKDGHALAFLSGVDRPAGSATLTLWDAAARQSKQVASSDQAPKGVDPSHQERPGLVEGRPPPVLRLQAAAEGRRRGRRREGGEDR